MTTLRFRVDPNSLDSPESHKAIEQAARILRSGGLVALPTETVYGLGANALDPDAVARIFAAKGRPAWDPVIVHIAEESMLGELATELPEAARKLIAAFWPGPLTLLLPRSPRIPDAVTAGRPLVGIRMPAHPVALELIRCAGIPVAAPSANVFGHTSPTTAAHVLHDLDRRIDAILDAGPTRHGVESTVLDPTQSPMVIYRPGAVTLEQIRAAAGPAELFKTDKPLSAEPPEAMPSPGVGIRHYAPRARLFLIDAPFSSLPRSLSDAATLHLKDRVGLLLPAELTRDAHLIRLRAEIFPWGRWSVPAELAHNLYAGLRALDSLGCTVILCPLPPAEGIGAALRDRLHKAAAQ
ncbi:MAG TPA: L-threonylcarbamoyladenylate synthase [Terracidiphilus sp.]|nr:L-threonylcarbamoyladenylate synthase [Terracidiphilus sp.]